MGRDLEEINEWFDCHRGEVNHLKTREKDTKEKVDELGGFIIGAAHEAKTFKSHLDRMEDNICRCGHTPSEVGEEFVSSEEEARTELSYASARGSKYVAPPVENPIPIPVPAPCHPCGLSTVLPPLEEITEKATFICEDLGGLPRETDCQEIGLVTPMFFFELSSPMFLSQFPSMLSLANLFSIIHSLICQLPKTLKTKEKQDSDSTNTGNSLNIILRLRNLSRFPNQPLDPMVDLYQSLHSNSASTTSMSPSISTTGASSILSTPRAPRKASPLLQRDQSSGESQIQRPSSEPGGLTSSSPRRTNPSLPDEMGGTPSSPLSRAVSIAPTPE